MRVNYDGPSFGLGKLDERRVFLSLIYLADIGILKVDGDTALGWMDPFDCRGGPALCCSPGEEKLSPEALV